MTAILPFLGILLLFALLVFPAIALSRGSGATLPASMFYAAVFFALGAYHIGLPRQAHADLTRPAPTLVGEQGVASELCGRMLEQVRQAGIIVDQPNARQVRVSRDDWSQLPDQVKEAITTCLSAPTRPGASQLDIEIVPVAGG